MQLREQYTVAAVFKILATRPAIILVKHWNWKSALLSSLVRAAIFLFSNLAAGWRSAFGAVLVEFGMRPILSGVFGSLTQAFRFARPLWLSGLIVMLLFPALAHLVEFTVHWLHGTPKLAASVAVSIAFSAVSGLLNLYFMRRGVLIVGEPDAAPFRSDLKRLPRVFFAFLAAGPLALYRLFRPAHKLHQPRSPR